MRARALFAALSATSALVSAQIPNGGFESGSLAGWTVELGSHSASLGGCGNFETSSTGGATPPGVTIYTASTVLPSVDNALLPDPFEGTSMALLNDPIGNFHACRLSRTFTLSASDLTLGGILGLEWGAVLEDPGHTGGCQPWFQLEVNACAGTSQQLFVDASDAASQGWLNVAAPGHTTPFYYKHDVWCVDLSSCPAGTSVTVRITAADCAHGGHGGFAFLDHVRMLECTPTPEGMVAWWHDDGLEDIALTNDAVPIGAWPVVPGSGKVGTESALIFDGTNHAEVPPHPPSFHFLADQGFACDLWVKPQNPLPFGAPLISHTSFHAGWHTNYDFHLEDRYLALSLKASGAAGFTHYVCTDARVPFDEWTHVAFSADRASSTLTFFINGEVRDVFSTATGTNQNGALHPSWMMIGRSPIEYAGAAFPSIAWSNFVGMMDEIEFFNRALSPAEVNAIFQTGCRGKCRPISITDWLHGIPALDVISLPALPIGTGGTGPVGVPGQKLVTVHGEPGGTSVTSTWDGATWRRHVLPGPTGAGAMTFDRARGVGVWIGNDPASQALEVWEWTPGPQGGQWSRRNAPGGPASAGGHALAWDDRASHTLLFGGRGPAGALDETWSWDGNAWRRLQTPVRPPARHDHAMTYDELRGVVVLCNGLDGSGNAIADTWLFDGATWFPARPGVQPPARSAHGLTYDRERGRCVLYGGTDGRTPLGDTWEWNGAQWLSQAVVNDPPARTHPVMLFDESRHKVVVLGGSVPADGMWWYGSLVPGTARSFGAGCAGWSGLQIPTLATSTRVWLGTHHDLLATNLPPQSLAVFALGFSNTDSPFGPLPLGLGPFGLHPTCTLLVDPFLSYPVPVVQGRATLTLGVPNDPIFLGLAYFGQTIAIDPVRNDLALSNGMEMSVGAM